MEKEARLSKQLGRNRAPCSEIYTTCVYSKGLCNKQLVSMETIGRRTGEHAIERPVVTQSASAQWAETV